MSSALWCVLNGFAAAPPMSVCIVGVSTSRKPTLVEDLAGRAHDVAARAEHLGDLRVGDEVDVALAIARLDVRGGRATSPAAGEAPS